MKSWSRELFQKHFTDPKRLNTAYTVLCNWQRAEDDWAVAFSAVSTGVSHNNVKWLKKEILVLQMSFSLQFPTGEEWFPLPVSPVSIIKRCVFVLLLSVLEFLASAVTADASRSEAEPACCAVTTHTLTHPDQLVGLYRNLYPRAQATTKVLLCR